MKPVVSVIIPCHNHAHYLSRAVQSILAQIYIDWEAVIVDDGSTDDTREVTTEFTDPRIRYIYQENRGLSAARNTGIRAAQGKYLAFLDADDEWEVRFLERCVRALRQQQALGFVYTRNRFIDQNGNVLPRLGGQVVPIVRFRQRLLEGGFFPPNAVLLRRQVLETVDDFDTRLTSVEDWDLWLRIAQHYPVLGIEEALVRYRIYPGSMSTNAGRMHANRIAVLTKHFGPPDGDPLIWPADKRRGYAFAYRAAALGYIAQKEADEGWRYLLRAVETDPDLLQRLDTFYELACGDQPRGTRGQAETLDIDQNGAEMLLRLDALFAFADAPVQALKGVAFGNAYLALGMLSDQAGDWGAARRYLLQAARYNPRLLYRSFLRRLVKVSVGQQAVGFLKDLRNPSTSSQLAPTGADPNMAKD